MKDPLAELRKEFEILLKENHADVLAHETILKTFITRILPPNTYAFLDVHEQQALSSLFVYEPRQRAQIEPRIVSFFAELREMVRADKEMLLPSREH